MEKAQINIKLTDEVKDKLQQIARSENMPVSKVVMLSLATRYPELIEFILKR
jgi:predicted transcriptional regulator